MPYLCRTKFSQLWEDINRWNNIPCSWIVRINIAKITILPKAIYRFIAILIKLPMAFFTELEQKDLRICMETQKTLNSQSNLEIEKWSWRNQAPWLWIIYKATDIKTVWYWYKNRNIDQWNRIESPEISSCTYGQLICDKGGKTTQCWKDSLFNRWCWDSWMATYKKMKLDHSLASYTKISSKKIKDLNVGPDTKTQRKTEYPLT